MALICYETGYWFIKLAAPAEEESTGTDLLSLICPIIYHLIL